MLLSRFWYVLLGLVVGALTFVLFLAQSMYNRAAAKAVSEALVADQTVVSWYMKNDARERAAHLVKFALNNDIAKSLAESSKSESSVPEKSRDQAKAGLKVILEEERRLKEEEKRLKAATDLDPSAKLQTFDVVYAVDQYGRVVAQNGSGPGEGTDGFELGGYPVVADALHGYVRADTLLLDRAYLVVARPVEYDLGQMPAGAIVGARVIDEKFAGEVAARTNTAVGFFVGDSMSRASACKPDPKQDPRWDPCLDKNQLDQIVSERATLKEDSDFKEKGTGNVHMLGETMAVIYSRIPGETWQLDVGFAVARKTRQIESIFDFSNLADDKDKQSGHTTMVGLIAFSALFIGLLLSVFEHTVPLRSFKRQVHRFAKSEIDHLQPSQFRGLYRQIASDLNDGIDHAVAKGGGSRRAADLNQVFGELPKQPQMSAFNVPGAESVGPVTTNEPLSAMPATVQNNPLPVPPRRAGLDRTAPQVENQAPPREPTPSVPVSAGVSVAPSALPPAGIQGTEGSTAAEVDADWPQVYQEFLRTKQSCGERIDGLSFEKFLHTLTKNRDAMIQRHGVKRVKFSVYVKEGRAALKVSPIRD